MTELELAVARGVDRARGDEELEAYAVHRVTTAIKAGTDTEIRDVSRAETVGLGIRIISNGSLGYASATDLDESSISLTVSRARANAAASERDDAQRLPDPEDVGTGDESLRPELDSFSLESRIEQVRDLARRTISADSRVTAIDAAEYHVETRNIAIASTKGVDVTHQGGQAELWVDALGEAGEFRGSEYAYQLEHNPRDFDPEALARKAVDRTVQLLGPTMSAPTGAPIILDPYVVAEILTAIGKALCGGPISTGRTPFAQRNGQRVAANCVSLFDDGLSPDSTRAAAYDDEGMRRRRTPLIQDGVLVGALHSTVTARAIGDGVASTGNATRTSHKAPPRAAPTSLALGATATRAELLAEVGEAIYVQQLSGAGVGISPVTGRIDVGASALLWRDGLIVGRLGVLPIATDLISLLESIDGVGDDTQPLPFSVASGSTVLCSSGLLNSID
jgi:PmbA protein